MTLTPTQIAAAIVDEFGQWLADQLPRNMHCPSNERAVQDAKEALAAIIAKHSEPVGEALPIRCDGDTGRVIPYGSEFAIQNARNPRLFLFKDLAWRYDHVECPDEWLWPTEAEALDFLQAHADQREAT